MINCESTCLLSLLVCWSSGQDLEDLPNGRQACHCFLIYFYTVPPFHCSTLDSWHLDLSLPQDILGDSCKILSHNIKFKVHHRTRMDLVKIGMFECIRDDCHLK